MLRSARRLLVAAVSLGLAVLAVRCGGNSNNPSSTKSVSSISIVGLQVYSAIGIKAQYQAVATFADGTTQDVSTLATWTSTDPARLSVTTAGLATYLSGTGAVTLTAAYKSITGFLVLTLAVSTEDCISYVGSALFPASAGDEFIVTDGQQLLFGLDTLAQAASTVTLMQRYSSLCYVGRSNNRANRLAYIFTYFKPAGPPPTLSPEDCAPYDKASLKITASADGWSLADSTSQVALLDSQSDADLLITVAEQYSSRCYIGRGNTRPNPLGFIVQYWK